MHRTSLTGPGAYPWAVLAYVGPLVMAEHMPALVSPMADSPITLDVVCQRARELYSLPAVAVKVLDLTNQPKTDLRALKECIEADPALTWRLLKVVNSAVYGLSREVRDLNQALALLGIKPLKLLVLGFSLPEPLLHGVEEEVLRRYWTRSLTMAVAAREISGRIASVPGDEAFISGLLHDIGTLALIQELGVPYARFLDKIRELGADRGELEERSLGFRHTTLGARLLEQWGLAEDLVAAVEQSHRLSRCAEWTTEPPPLHRILYLSQRVADFMESSREECWELLIAASRACGCFTEAEWEQVVERLESRVGELAKLLNLQVRTDWDTAEMLKHARKRLATTAADLAADLVRQEVDARLVRQEKEDAARLAVEEFISACRTTTAPAAPSAAGSQGRWAGSASPIAAPAAVPQRTPRDLLDQSQLVARVTSAAVYCRKHQKPLSVLLLAVDHFEDMVFSHGLAQVESLMEILARRLNGVDPPMAGCVRLGDSRLGCILPECDRRQVIGIGHEQMSCAATVLRMEGAVERAGITLSAGAATAEILPKNFSARDLLEAAWRCLDAAVLSGGNQLKSIGVY